MRKESFAYYLNAKVEYLHVQENQLKPLNSIACMEHSHAVFFLYNH